MARNPYEPKGFDKWAAPAILLRGLSELFGSGRKRWLAEQAEKSKHSEKDDKAPPQASH